jgi:outer membrane protein TolC
MKTKYIIILLFLVSFITGKSEELSLSEAIAIGLKNNYSIVIEKQNIETSKTNNSWGNAGALPNLSVGLTNTFNLKSGDTDLDKNNNLGLNIQLANINLFNGFVVFINKNKLDELEKYAQGNYVVLIENTIEKIMIAYYNVIFEKEKLEASSFILDLTNDRYYNEKKRFDKGTKTSYELLQAKQSLLQDKSSYLSAKTTYENSIRDLNYVLGETNDVTYQFPDTVEFKTLDYVMKDMIQKIESNNNTIKNQFINLNIKKLDIEKAKSGYYPTLTGNLGYNFSNDYSSFNTANNSVTNNTGGLSASLSLNYKIYTGGERSRALQIAQINKEVEQVKLDQMKHSLRNQLYKMNSLYETNKEKLELATEELEVAKQNLHLSGRKYNLGALSSFNYRDVQYAYSNSQIAKSRVHFELIKNWISLLKITGGITEIDND